MPLVAGLRASVTLTVATCTELGASSDALPSSVEWLQKVGVAVTPVAERICVWHRPRPVRASASVLAVHCSVLWMPRVH